MRKRPPLTRRGLGLGTRYYMAFTGMVSMVSLGFFFYFCSYKTQENIRNSIFVMVLRGV